MNIPIFNPGQVASELSGKPLGELSADDSLAGAVEVERRIERAIDQGSSIAVETVLSSDKYWPIVHRAKQVGFRCGMIYIALSDPKIAIERVALRVAAGGHRVPAERIPARWKRSLDNLVRFGPTMDRIIIFCNDEPGAPTLITEVQRTEFYVHYTGLPAIDQTLRRLYDALKGGAES